MTTGWRSVFSVPAVYRATQSAIGSGRFRRELVDRYVGARPGDRVLDIGCGTGDLAPYFEQSSYVGYDMSAAYVEAARATYGGDDVEFRIGRVGDERSPDDVFDIATAVGVLHHLDDDEARLLFAEAHEALRPGGRLVTIDPAFVEGQHRIAKALISRDRGREVRTPDGYAAIARTAFGDVEVDVRHDLLRLPYTHAVLVCTRA